MCQTRCGESRVTCNMWTWEKSRNGMTLKSITAADINVGDKMVYWQSCGGYMSMLIFKN